MSDGVKININIPNLTKDNVDEIAAEIEKHFTKAANRERCKSKYPIMADSDYDFALREQEKWENIDNE